MSANTTSKMHNTWPDHMSIMMPVLFCLSANARAGTERKFPLTIAMESCSKTASSYKTSLRFPYIFWPEITTAQVYIAARRDISKGQS